MDIGGDVSGNVIFAFRKWGIHIFHQPVYVVLGDIIAAILFLICGYRFLGCVFGGFFRLLFFNILLKQKLFCNGL